MNSLRQAVRASASGSLRELESGVERVFVFKEDFVGFRGHFPGNPILPAVVEVLTAVVLLEEWKGRNITLKSVENAKFKSPVKPGDAVEVRCVEKEHGPAGSVVSATIESNGKKTASMLLEVF